MEKNGKEPQTIKHRSFFVMKMFLLVFGVVIVLQFVLILKGFASLKALNNKFNALEEEQTLALKSLRKEKHKHGTKRSKRGTGETDIKSALIKLEKLEGR